MQAAIAWSCYVNSNRKPSLSQLQWSGVSFHAWGLCVKVVPLITAFSRWECLMLQKRFINVFIYLFLVIYQFIAECNQENGYWYEFFVLLKHSTGVSFTVLKFNIPIVAFFRFIRAKTYNLSFFISINNQGSKICLYLFCHIWRFLLWKSGLELIKFSLMWFDQKLLNNKDFSFHFFRSEPRIIEPFYLLLSVILTFIYFSGNNKYQKYTLVEAIGYMSKPNIVYIWVHCL